MIQGTVALLIVLGVYEIARRQGLGDDAVRTVAFVALVLAVFALVLANRARRSILTALASGNGVLVLVFAVVLGAIIAVVSLAPLRALFLFGAIERPGWLLALLGGLACLPALEVVKLSFRPRAP